MERSVRCRSPRRIDGVRREGRYRWVVETDAVGGRQDGFETGDEFLVNHEDLNVAESESRKSMPGGPHHSSVSFYCYSESMWKQALKRVGLHSLVCTDTGMDPGGAVEIVANVSVQTQGSARRPRSSLRHDSLRRLRDRESDCPVYIAGASDPVAGIL
jgi:hypothetical protein